MSETIDLLSLASGSEHQGGQLELLRLGADELGLIPFSTDVGTAAIHYCGEPEVNAYVRCNGPNCVLCNTGRKQDERYLMPVYCPTLKAVVVLPISPSMQPFALLPLLLEVFELLEHSDDRVVLFVRRGHRNKFSVTTSPLPDNVDTGERQIKAFLEKFEAGSIDLASVYNRLSNKQLEAVPAIAEMMRLKGITPDGAD